MAKKSKSVPVVPATTEFVPSNLVKPGDTVFLTSLTAPSITISGIEFTARKRHHTLPLNISALELSKFNKMVEMGVLKVVVLEDKNQKQTPESGLDSLKNFLRQYIDSIPNEKNAACESLSCFVKLKTLVEGMTPNEIIKFCFDHEKTNKSRPIIMKILDEYIDAFLPVSFISAPFSKQLFSKKNIVYDRVLRIDEVRKGMR